MNADLAAAVARPDVAPARASLARFRKPRHALAAPVLVTLALALSPFGLAYGQNSEGGARTMTVEELERFIAEQKAALEQVRENRDVTARKMREVRAALTEKEAARREREAELERLCRERDALDPGSYEGCVSQSAGAAEEVVESVSGSTVSDTSEGSNEN